MEINIKLPCRALVTMGVFMSDRISDFKRFTQEGVITEYDEESHYVNWTIDDVLQPSVHINSVNFLL